MVAASLGWMLDSFDVMLFSLVLGPLMKDLGLTKSAAGVLGSMTLCAAAVGGLLFGLIADRYGRVFAMRWSVLIYAVFTGACGLAQGFVTLLVFRVLLGLGMGGEWASGAALVSETWPAEHRGKALGLVQSSWAIGYALAAAAAAIVLPHFGWRGVFAVGLLPALLTLWVRRRVAEPAGWTSTARRGRLALGGFADLFRGRLLKLTTLVTGMNACTLFAWWGFNLWVPAYLSLPARQGGLGLTSRSMTIVILVMQVGMWLGYVSFGVISDAIGRKPTYVAYLLSAGVLLSAFSLTHSKVLLLLLGPLTAFFGTGYFSGLGAVTAEIYDTSIRATGQGFTYNVGRVASAAAPFAVGSWAEGHGFPAAFRLAALSFGVAAALWIWIPETKAGRPIADERVSVV